MDTTGALEVREGNTLGSIIKTRHKISIMVQRWFTCPNHRVVFRKQMRNKLQALIMTMGITSTNLCADKVSYLCFEFLHKTMDSTLIFVLLQQLSKLCKMLNRLAPQCPLNSTRIYSLSLTKLFLRKAVKYSYQPSIMLCSMVVQDLLETTIKLMLTAIVLLTRVVMVEIIFNHRNQIMNFKRIRSLITQVEINSNSQHLSLGINTYSKPCHNWLTIWFLLKILVGQCLHLAIFSSQSSLILAKWQYCQEIRMWINSQFLIRIFRTRKILFHNFNIQSSSNWALK